MRFKDKTVLITGASRGLGKVTALMFAKEGAIVVINYLSSNEKVKELIKEIEAIGGEAIMFRADVSTEKEVEEMIKYVIKRFKKIDVLVNNAGIIYDMPLKSRKIEFWDRTMNVNLKGTFICSRQVSKYMLKERSGSIINIASVNPIYKCNPQVVDYDVSKAGVIALTHNLSMELAPNIRVNAVAPGWIDTEMNQNLPNEYREEETERIFLKRFAKPEEIANVILFIASEEASFMNNSVIKVDGGYR